MHPDVPVVTDMADMWKVTPSVSDDMAWCNLQKDSMMSAPRPLLTPPSRAVVMHTHLTFVLDVPL